MCLLLPRNYNIQKANTISNAQKRNGRITVYKEVSVYISWSGHTTVKSPYHGYNIVNGWYHSNRSSSDLSRDEQRCLSVNQGIHCYVEHPNYTYVIKCWAYAKDLVAIGWFDGVTCAVFTKIFIPKPEIDSVVALATKNS